ncbi:cellulose biosynthesis cyclic di-GMP-binding regulatory protein BcsB [Azospirillum sp. SYSU D00513]|uniref:cellulose biosynthesis cyclic di-GMP-binding regulatory protein BcsB n=1 Tax=Azospirillum sp. SYSU D00513 TaxID=2812561 RepID=UPI001A95C8F6|nr:cellulose biosynthesis cyclic di-GMP-binding regulatory protein BcsB [Azospirillum sp. SYSU D00513]
MTPAKVQRSMLPRSFRPRAMALPLLLAVLTTALLPARAVADERTISFANLRDGAPAIEMQGEDASLELEALIPPTGPLRQVVLNVTYENGIDILPDKSRMMLALNGEPVAELPLSAYHGPASASITLPPERIRPGRNRITFVQEAQHRALCNVRGTYDLWSRIHLARSSLTLRSDMAPPVPDLAMLPQLLGASRWLDAPLAILRAGTAMGPDHLGWGALVAQGYSLALNGRAPRVVSAALPARRPQGAPADGKPLPPEMVPSPKSVIVGLRDDLGGLLDPAIVQGINGPFLGVYPTGVSPGSFLVVVSGRTPDEVDRAVLRLAAIHQPLPPQASAVVDLPTAAAPARAVAEPGRHRLSDLGYTTTSHVGYRYTAPVTLRLPADFKPVADQTMALRINAAFEGDLGRGSVLNVRVNGRLAGSIDVDKRSSGALERAEMGLPMTLFRSGDNRIEIEAELPPQQETGCLLAVRKPRFTLMDSSELEIPTFGRLVGLPDLGATGRTGFPYARPAGDDWSAAWKAGTGGQPHHFDLVVAGEGESWPAVAWTLTARLAQNAGTLIHPIPSIGWNAPVGRDALIVGPIGNLPQMALASTAVAPDRLASLLEAGTRMSLAAAAGDPLPSGDRQRLIDQLRGATAAAYQPTAGGASAAVAEPSTTRWERLAGRTPSESTGLFGTLFDRALDLAGRNGAGDTAADSADGLNTLGESGYLPDAALLQFQAPGEGNGTWTVLTGADAGIVAQATQRLAADPLWSDLGGGAMLWRSGGGGGSTIRPSERYSVLTHPYDPGNLLLVAASSLSQRIDVLFFLLLATVVTLTTAVRLLLRMSQRRD